MAEIIFERTDGNLGRLPASEDATSGLLVIAHTSKVPAELIEGVFTSMKEAKEWTYDFENLYLEGYFPSVFKQIEDFFRMQPNGRLYVRIFVPQTTFVVDSSFITDNILALQNAANGKIRQIGAFFLTDNAGKVGNGVNDTDLTLSDNYVLSPPFNFAATALRNQHAPVHILLSVITGHFSALSFLRDFRNSTDNQVSVVIGSNADNAVLGAALGTLSKSKVHENIGWVEKFNIGLENPTLFINNDTIKISDLSEVDLQTLTTKGYIFPRKYVGLSGTYWNDSPTCSALTSDFAYIENNRTLDKAVRLTRILLLPSLNSPVRLNPDGTLTAKDVNRLRVTASKALEQMQRDGEVSNFSVFIDPTQNVLSTSQIEIEMNVQPVGVARKLNVKIGLAQRIGS